MVVELRLRGSVFLDHGNFGWDHFNLSAHARYYLN